MRAGWPKSIALKGFSMSEIMISIPVSLLKSAGLELTPESITKTLVELPLEIENLNRAVDAAKLKAGKSMNAVREYGRHLEWVLENSSNGMEQAKRIRTTIEEMKNYG